LLEFLRRQFSHTLPVGVATPLSGALSFAAYSSSSFVAKGLPHISQQTKSKVLPQMLRTLFFSVQTIAAVGQTAAQLPQPTQSAEGSS
jgi:hypothetical protein